MEVRTQKQMLREARCNEPPATRNRVAADPHVKATSGPGPRSVDRGPAKRWIQDNREVSHDNHAQLVTDIYYLPSL
jgi:hypothetical protein